MAELEMEKVLAVSTQVGELIQTLPRPRDAFICLMVTLGRLIAREGYQHLTSETAWETVTKSKDFFDAGYNGERTDSNEAEKAEDPNAVLQ